MLGTGSHDEDLARRSFDRILLVKPSSLGDVVHALPVLHGLRTRYPNARIDWLCATPFVGLLQDHPDLNEVVPFDRSRFGRLGRSFRVTRDFLRFVGDLRSRAYDLVIDLQGLFRSGFLSRATGAPTRLGFVDAREGAPWFYNHRIAVDGPDTHAVDRNYKVARLLGFADVPVSFNLALSEAVRAEASERLRRLGLTSSDRVVAIVPGARWETKVWYPHRFAETIDELQAADDVRCVLLGGPDEIALCEKIAGACRSTPLNLGGKTTLRQLAATLGLADCVLCHDSGAMHVAVALDRPLVCLIGPTNPRRTGPYGRGDAVLQVQLDCSPCYYRRLEQCPHDHRCMRELDSPTVASAVRRALGVERA
ncbi:MAG: lipopolysaccharide heptosyltransferase II [Planctomycetes bacterium]|nr:lipopolysaccharide heptosyltransferase II [Planctomycetota bacterium]